MGQPAVGSAVSLDAAKAPALPPSGSARPDATASAQAGTPARQGLLACLRELLETRHGGRVAKRYLHELITAARA